MRPGVRRQVRLLTGLGLLTLGVVGLSVLLSPSMPVPKRSPRVVLAQSLEGLPYHPIVYHLDLTVLAYQLYSQSLVWPFDPYYEDLDPPPGRREDVMDAVRQFAADRGVEKTKAASATRTSITGATRRCCTPRRPSRGRAQRPRRRARTAIGS